MANVLLILPGSTTFYGNPRYPAGGISMIGAVLLRAGHHVEALDMRFSKVNDTTLENKIKEGAGFDIVGFSVTNWDVLEAVRVSGLIRRLLPHATIVFGGPQASLCPEETLQFPEVDILVLGEGEATILELVERLGTGASFEDVRGIAYRDQQGKPVVTEKRPLIKDLSQLPPPAYHLFDVNAYRAAGELRLGVMSSRGCPYGCIFCTGRSVMGKAIRYRPPESVVSEIEHWHTAYGASHFCFLEDNWLGNRKKAIELLDRLEEANLNITYSLEVGVRGDALTPDICRRLKKTGCTIVAIGIESVDPEVLSMARKGETIEAITQGIRAAKAAGLFVKGYFIVGLPGDNRQKVEKAVAFARKEGIDMPRFALAQAFPHTELAEWVAAHGRFYHDPYEYVLKNTDEIHGDVHYDFPGFEKPEIWAAYRWAHDQAEQISFQRALERRFGGAFGTLLNLLNTRLTRRMAIWCYQHKLVSLPR